MIEPTYTSKEVDEMIEKVIKQTVLEVKNNYNDHYVNKNDLERITVTVLNNVKFEYTMKRLDKSIRKYGKK